MTDAERITELEETVRQRDARIAELEGTVGELSKVIEAWKRGHRVRPGGKIAQKTREKRRVTGRGPGRPEGHEGTSRPAPTSADRDVLVPVPETCPCGGIIDPTGEEPGEHFVEELIPARKEVIRFRRCRGRCRNGKAAVLAPLPDGLGPSPKLGVRAQAEIVQSKTELGLTLGQTRTLFERQGLTLSRGGIQPILHRSAEVLAAGHEVLKAAIPTAAVAWADESTHKVDGASGDLWLVMTPEVVRYEADRSRGQEVAQRLFQGFTGTLHSDVYSVYGTLAGIAHAPWLGPPVPKRAADRGAPARLGGGDDGSRSALGALRPWRRGAGATGDGRAQRAGDPGRPEGAGDGRGPRGEPGRRAAPAPDRAAPAGVGDVHHEPRFGVGCSRQVRRA